MIISVHVWAATIFPSIEYVDERVTETLCNGGGVVLIQLPVRRSQVVIP